MFCWALAVLPVYNLLLVFKVICRQVSNSSLVRLFVSKREIVVIRCDIRCPILPDRPAGQATNQPASHIILIRIYMHIYMHIWGYAHQTQWMSILDFVHDDNTEADVR